MSGTTGSATTGIVPAISAIAIRDLHRQVRRPGMLLSNAVQMLFFVVIYAVGFDPMVSEVDGVPFSAYVLPGLIAIQTAAVGVTTGLSYAWDREFGVLREMMVAPVPRLCLPLGKAVGTTAVVTAQSLAMLLCAPLFGLHLPAWRLLVCTLVFLLGGLMFSLLGLFLATVLRRMQTLQAAVQLSMFPMLFLSGSVFSPEGVPGWLGIVIRLNPLTYLVDLSRQLALGVPGLHHPLVDLAAVLGAVTVFATLTSSRP